MLDFTKMSHEELIAYAQRQEAMKTAKCTVKLNSSGGVYISHPDFQEYSEKHGKNYQAGLNIGYTTARALFNNPELLAMIKDTVNGIKK